MKKTIAGLFIAGILIFTACSGKKESTLTVGATPVPHGELLNLVKDDVAAKGYTLKVVEFSDYVQPNSALIAGDLDANFFQHIPYLETNAEWSEKLVSAFGVHIEPFGLYSSKYANVADLPDGATIAIPNDPSNGGRALQLLAAKGLIGLKSDNFTVTVLDISENPKNFKFRELEAAQLPRSLADVDAATINGNFALEAGLNPVKDSLLIEGAESPYVNIVVTQKGKELEPKIIALKEALLSDKVRDFINNNYNGGVAPIF